MPFRVDKVKDGYKLFKLKEKTYAKVKFKSKCFNLINLINSNPKY